MQIRRGIKRKGTAILPRAGLRVVQIRRGIKPPLRYIRAKISLRVVQIRRGIKLERSVNFRNLV